MSVYRTLTDVRGQIEQLRGRKNLLDNQIGFSTVNLTLDPGCRQFAGGRGRLAARRW